MLLNHFYTCKGKAKLLNWSKICIKLCLFNIFEAGIV